MKRILALLMALLVMCSIPYALAEESGAQNAQADEEIIDEALEDEWLEDDEALLDLDESDYNAGLDEMLVEEGDTDEDVLMGAMEVYAWFVLQTLDTDRSLPDSTGEYFRVLDERFNTPESMRDMLDFYFSDEISQSLMDMGVYIEEDGYLYTNDNDNRAIDERITETEMTVASQSDERVEYLVTVNYSEPVEDGLTKESFTYVRELIDGEWRFTTFPFFW